MTKCSFIKDSGEQCGANSHGDGEFCYRHDPEVREVAIEASRRGGMNRALQVVCGAPVEVKTAADVTSLLGKVINGVWAGEIPAQLGSAIGFLSNCWLKAYEYTEIEERVKAIEVKFAKKS